MIGWIDGNGEVTREATGWQTRGGEKRLPLFSWNEQGARFLAPQPA